MIEQELTIDKFLFDFPLYHKVDKEDFDNLSESLSKEDEDIAIEGYNSIKNSQSTFYLLKGLGDELVCDFDSYGNPHNGGYYTFIQEQFDKIGVKTIRIVCKRYGDEMAILVFHNPKESVLMKVGQYPSMADVHIGKVRQYNKVLEKSLVREFTKAIGLAANGVGIGAYVYLRRIFERLIIDAANIAKENENLDIEQFERLRMDEKIKSLRNYLPPFIADHQSVYGILSKGIHELSEEECLEYFDIMRNSIELILDQRIEMHKKQRKQKEIEKQLSVISAKHKK